MNIGIIYHTSLGIRIEGKVIKTYLAKSIKSRVANPSESLEFTKKKDFEEYLASVLESEDTKIVILKSGKNVDEIKEIFSFTKNHPVGPYGLTEVVSSNMSAKDLACLDLRNRNLIEVSAEKESVEELEVKLEKAKAKKAKSKKKAEAVIPEPIIEKEPSDDAPEKVVLD